MGYNTTVVVYNDALGAIENDPTFGSKVAKAVRHLSVSDGKPVDIPAGNHANAAMAVESHHADNTAVITVGGNLGIKQLELGGWLHHEKPMQERLLRAWADELGFTLVKKQPK